MTDTANLALPYIDAAQAQKHVTHNEALRMLDTLVQLAVLDRDLNAPPGSPAEGQRWIVKASPSPTGAWAGHGNQVAAWQDGALAVQRAAGRLGRLRRSTRARCIAWNGSAWVERAVDAHEPAEHALLGLGTTADSTNPFSAKLNNTLWVAKTVAEGGDGNLRYKMSKESAAKTLSLLFQDNFSGRAEIGLTGDDDFHFKVSPDGTTWVDALLLDKTTGAAKVNSAFYLTGDISPTQITADQNDYNPAGLANAAVLRLSTDATRNITGLSGGGDGRVMLIANVGSNNIVLKDASASSSAANRFAFGADLAIAANRAVLLLYDATSSRWRDLSSVGALLAANNLSDLASASTARTNLGLGSAATQNTGTSGANVPLLSAANTWSGAQAAAAKLDIQQDVYFSGDISPTQITADQNDYNPTGLAASSVLRLNSDASRNVTGLQGGADGRVICIINVGSNPIVLKNQGASSSAANRFLFGIDITLAAEQSVRLWYDATSSRWRQCAYAPTGKLIGVQVFTASGTYTRSAGCRTVIAEVIAGGGSAGGVGAAGASTLGASSGGGGGGYSMRRVAAPGSTETVTVGAGGAATSAAAVTGNTGGTSSFGSWCSATGGAGGSGASPSSEGASAAMSAGGAGSGGDLNLMGDAGGIGLWKNGLYAIGGKGGMAARGGGGGVGMNVSPGGSGANYGGGGGGSANNNSGAGVSGAAGAGGAVIVWEFE